MVSILKSNLNVKISAVGLIKHIKCKQILQVRMTTNPQRSIKSLFIDGNMAIFFFFFIITALLFFLKSHHSNFLIIQSSSPAVIYYDNFRRMQGPMTGKLRFRTSASV